MTKKTLPVHFSSASVEWYTPPWLVEHIRALLGGAIDLDPASCQQAQQTVQARHWCGRDHPDPAYRDGLLVDWNAYATVFVNPPYGKWLPAFVAKAVSCSAPIVLLLPARTETAWATMLFDHAFDVIFLRKRVVFLSNTPNAERPPFPSMLALRGIDYDHARAIFGEHHCLRVVW